MHLSKLMVTQGLLAASALACRVPRPNHGGAKIDTIKNELIKSDPITNDPITNDPVKEGSVENETAKDDPTKSHATKNNGTETESILEPGLKWEICIHKPIKHDSVDDIIPSEAAVFGIDLAHAQEFPGMIPVLKVGLALSLPLPLRNISQE